MRAPVLLRNVGANKNHFVRLDLTGLADNKTALGVKVEVFANGLWQKWELAGASGYQTQAPPQILVGLGQAPGIDLLRILWPTGVLQDEIDLPRQQVIAMKEADRRGSSCPVLFAWDGHKYKFVTDVIGAAVVGHWFTPTRRNTPNPGEWVKIDGANVAPVNGKISVRFMEPMEEVNYIDQLRMVAVDHPESVEVNPDERFLDDPPFASGRVVASAGTRLPVGAWDGEGRDVLDQLSRRDHVFASGFKALPYDGFANLHALTLDLGEIEAERAAAAADDRLRELLQRDIALCRVAGGVEGDSAIRRGGAARWHMAADRRRCRISRRPGAHDRGGPDGQAAGGHAAHPADDEFADLLGPGADRSEREMPRRATTEVPLAAATLHFRGYPKQIEGASPGDLDYDYNLVSLSGPFQRERGNYTHFGDVTRCSRALTIVSSIFGSGEEIAAEFDASKSACAACALEARLLFLCQWVREGHGLVGCVAIHRGADAVPRNDRLSLSGAGKISRRCGRARLPVELERPVRLGRAGALLPVRLSAAARGATGG